MSPAAAARRTRPAEREILEVAARALAAQGFRAYLDPDGSSYFDLIVRRGDEVGLVEGKVGHSRLVLAQALRRRAWGDWVGVVLDSSRAAERLVTRTASSRAACVGVWSVVAGELREHRPPVVRSAATGADPFPAHRARLRAALEAIDRGESPPGVGWSGVPREVRRASGGRAFAEWRLDEGWPAGAQPDDATGESSARRSAATRSGAKRAP